MPLALFLISMVAPIAKRLLVALGIGIVTYAGYDAVLSHFIDSIQAQFAQAGDLAQIASLMGIQQSIGIVLGAITTRLSLQTFKRFQIL